MTRDELVTIIGQRLGNRTDLDVEIKTNLNWVQQNELEGCKEFLAWFLLDPEFTVTIAQGVNYADVSAMLQPDDGAIIRIYPTLEPTAAREIELRQRDRGVGHLLTDVAAPSQLTLFHDKLYVDRLTDQEYKVYFAAYVREPLLSDIVTTNEWSNKASDWMAAEVLKKMALRVGDGGLYGAAKQEAADAKARVWSRSEAFENAGKDYRMGVSSERRTWA